VAAPRVLWLGADVAYHDGMRVMRQAIDRIDDDGPVLLLLEHSPTITTTRRGGMGAFVSSAQQALMDGIEVVETDRGGDVTYHGPGQLVGYPVMRLGPTSLGCDVVGFVRRLEAGIIGACVELGVKDARRQEGKDGQGNMLTGVWCHAPVVAEETLGCNFVVVEQELQKICALGIGLSVGVTRHGFALNVTTQLERFTKHIIPCGLRAHRATSLERVLMRPPPMERVRAAVAKHVSEVMGSL
jgi:lipoyl(octanoyl) transferase